MKLVLPQSDSRLGEAWLTVHALAPLPFDLAGWRDAALRKDLGGAEVSLVSEEQAETRASGWPVHLVLSDVLADGTIRERRLHAFYRFAELGAIAVLAGTPRAVDAALARARDLFLGAVPDLSTPEPLTIDQLWAGFDEPPADT